MSMLTRLAGVGLAAVLSVTIAGMTTPASAAPVPGQRVFLTLGGDYPTEQNRAGVFSVIWTSGGTEDLAGPTHFTVDLPPGVTTSGAIFDSAPHDYTFTQTVSPDGRRVEAVLLGNRRAGREEFMEIPVTASETGPVTGAITATVANANDPYPTAHIRTYVLGPYGGLQPPTIGGGRPEISTVDTTTGPGAGGTPVTITGTWLVDAMVLIDGVPAPGTCTPTTCTVTTPGGSGSAAITVVGPGGVSDPAPVTFDYTGAPPSLPAPVLSGSTPGGPVAGGTEIVITGQHLASGTVAFDGTRAPHFSCGPQLCTATAPAADHPGPVDITVATAGGTSAPVTYTYTS
ncbi:IPT/TIG domain-containing protein [Streptomyces sp. DT171]|uniref:IPT/TIG domain-containing protein n=1 Tax=Streptomyces sp. DT171 TaxID=3416524 RepID=UPI003CF729D8